MSSDRDQIEEVARGLADRKVRRRTIAAGLAWATPVVVLGSATPAYALSCASAGGTLTAVSVNGPGYTGANFLCYETTPNTTAFYRNTQEICYTAVFKNNTGNTLASGSQTIRLETLSADYKTIRLASATSSLGGSVPISSITYSGTTTPDPNSTRYTVSAGTAVPNPRMTFTINKSIAPGETITFVYCTKYVSSYYTLPQDGEYPSILATSPCGSSLKDNNSINYNDAYPDKASVMAICTTCVC